MTTAEPPKGCRRCPRLVAHRRDLAKAHPDWWGGAVPSVGPVDAQLLVVGLAPGRMGAHRTGKSFAGDASGEVLFAALHSAGLASSADPMTSDPRNTMITNALRCLPPENRPTAAELAKCRSFLTARIAALPELRAVLALGRVAHEAVLKALDVRLASAPFAHGAVHRIAALSLYDSYHCSRYNMNTRRLTQARFDQVFSCIADDLGLTRSRLAPAPPSP